MADYSPETAIARIRRVRVGLILDHPYLASAVARIPLVRMPASLGGWIAATDGFHILVDPEQLGARPEADIRFILTHELLHVVLDHLGRHGTRDQNLWNIAVDHATNLMLIAFGFRAPEDALADKRFTGMTAEAIYDALLPKKRGASARTTNRKKGKSPGFDCHCYDLVRPLGPPQEPGEIAGAESDWPPSLMQVDALPPNEVRRIRQGLCLEMQKELKRRGNMPGGMEQEILLGSQSSVNWVAQLAWLLSGFIQNQYNWFPPNKKHLWRDLYLPSTRERNVPHLVIAIDASGSMSVAELKAILAEIDAARTTYHSHVTLIECDAAVRRVRHLEYQDPLAEDGIKVRMRGRGGTDFRPVFQWVEQALADGTIDQPSAIIYCTDGDGRAPQHSPPYPVLWVTTGRTDFAFGTVIRIPPHSLAPDK